MCVLGRIYHGQVQRGLHCGREGREQLYKDRTPLCIHPDTHTHLVMFSSAFTILISSSWYPVSPTPHHGMARSPGSLYSERCHTDGNRSRDTASPYKTRAWRSDIKTNVDTHMKLISNILRMLASIPGLFHLQCTCTVKHSKTEAS